MKKISKVLYRYEGGIDEVDVVLPSGRTINIKRGDSIELLPNEVTALSVLPGWVDASKDSSATPDPNQET